MDGEATRYSAFISYSHQDARFAAKLQTRLESYRLPRRLRTMAGLRVDGGGRLGPVFRDVSELAASPSLSAAVQAAIAHSDSLIVLATPASARSNWVGKEIALFCRAHGSDRIVAALLAGEPAEAFHPALQEVIEGEALEPLAADFRKHGDGRIAFLKLIAFLTDVPLDALIRRDALRRRRAIAFSAGASAVLMLILATIGTLALVANREKGIEQQRGAEMVNQMVSQREALTRAGRLELLQQQDRAALSYFAGREMTGLPPASQLLGAKLLQGIAQDSDEAGDVDGLGDAALKAEAITAALLAEAPKDAERVMAQAQSEYWLGLAEWRRNVPADAERHFRAYAGLAARLVAIDPRRADWQREAGDADSNLATFLLQTIGDRARAAALFASAQARLLKAEALGPWNIDIERDLADGYGWLADIQRLSGDYPAALAMRVAQRRVVLAMRAHDPGDATVEMALIKNQLGLARIAALQGRWMDAIAGFEDGRAKALARAAVDPGNADAPRQARAFDLFEASAWLDMPVALRPPPARIDRQLAGCKPEKTKPSSESAIFCSLLLARQRAAEGQKVAANAILSNIVIDGGATALSQRWRIDFAAERKKTAAAVSGASE